MDGAQALTYVRERYSLPRGDLDRTHRQQAFLRAVLAKTLTAGSFSSPLKAKKLLDNVTSTVSVDDRLSDSDLRDLMWSVKGVRTGDMVFMNAPVGGFDTIKGQSVSSWTPTAPPNSGRRSGTTRWPTTWRPILSTGCRDL